MPNIYICHVMIHAPHIIIESGKETRLPIGHGSEVKVQVHIQEETILPRNSKCILKEMGGLKIKGHIERETHTKMISAVSSLVSKQTVTITNSKVKIHTQTDQFKALIFRLIR